MLSLKMTFTILTLAAVSFSFYKKTISLSWQSHYKKDLQIIHDTLQNNHPGFYDDENPDFKRWLSNGYQQALSKTKDVHCFQDYKKNLCLFADGFKDNHLRIIDPAENSATHLKTPILYSFSKSDIPRSNKKRAWIKISSFYPQTTTEKESLSNIIKEAKNYRLCDQIIFDVRGNKGGNSYYGQQLLENIYGEEYCNAVFKKLYQPQYIEWRASEDNIAYLTTLVTTLQAQFGEKSDIAREFSDIIAKCIQENKNGQPLCKISNNQSNEEIPLDIHPLVSPQIIVITDGFCASACLDFLDQLTALTPFVQIGMTTNSDTDYLECRDVVLPSSSLKLHFPIKMFRNRPRKAGQAYVPEYEINDIYNNTVITETIDKITKSL